MQAEPDCHHRIRFALTSEAWEALNKTLKAIDLVAFSFSKDDLSWKPDGNWGAFSSAYRSLSAI
jgi:hypothetical protein